MNNFYPKQIAYILSVLALFILASCANIPLKTIPPPSSTAKLRVYVQPLTGQGRWDTPHEDYVEKTGSRVEKFLDETGIYEVVTKSDIRAVMGDQSPAKWEMERNGWAFARDIGRALHADYVMIIERSKERSSLGYGADFYFIIKMINTGTGKIFEAWSMVSMLDRSDHDKVNMAIKATYRDAFFSAKLDMLETAIKKSRSSSLQDKNTAIQPSAEVTAKVDLKPQVTAPEVNKAEPDKNLIAKQDMHIPESGKTEIGPKQNITVAVTQPPAEVSARVEPKPRVTAPEAKKPEPLLQDKKKTDTSKPMDVSAKVEPKPQVSAPEPPEKGRLKVDDKAPVMQGETVSSGGARLVIYDLESPENVKTVALILTEVLREEFFRLKLFTLVNRETLQQILNEMTIQQTGLIDEKQAVKAGKGLAANQVVTGRLGMLGKTYILQAKRIDVETFATLGFASTKFVQGQEEDVLSKLPDLAKSLAGLQQ